METQTTTQDARGAQFAANSITIVKNKPHYNGAPFQELIKDVSDPRTNRIYNIISYGVNVGTICLSDEDYNTINDLLNPIDFTRANNDTNGNPRFICHFLSFIGRDEKFNSLDEKYEIALKRSRQLGGKKYHNKKYGGGIVFQMYDGEQIKMSQRIKEIVKQA